MTKVPRIILKAEETTVCILSRVTEEETEQITVAAPVTVKVGINTRLHCGERCHFIYKDINPPFPHRQVIRTPLYLEPRAVQNNLKPADRT